MTNTELAKRSYEASRTAAGQTLDGKNLPSWDDLPQSQRDLWESAAGATYAAGQSEPQRRIVQGANPSPETDESHVRKDDELNSDQDAPKMGSKARKGDPDFKTDQNDSRHSVASPAGGAPSSPKR